MESINLSKWSSIPKGKTPTRCRSLDSLLDMGEIDPLLPAPGQLRKRAFSTSEEDFDDDEIVYLEQDSYTLPPPATCPTAPSHHQREESPMDSVILTSQARSNKVCRPIQPGALENLIAIQKLRHKMSLAIQRLKESCEKCDSSMSSLTSEFSKISFTKSPEPTKAQLASLNCSRGIFARRPTSVLESRKRTRMRKKDMDDTSKPCRKSRLKLSGRATAKSKSEPRFNVNASKQRFSHVKSTKQKAKTKKN